MNPTIPILQPQTFAQKALARAAGLDHVAVGQVIDARPDVVLSHDNTAAIRQTWLEFGQKRVVIPEKMAITMDHAVPAPTTRHAQNHAEIRAFVAEQGVKNVWEVGRGICHQVLSEEAIVLPGQTILGSDSHTTHFGWMGAFGTGIGRSEVAALWATGELWLRVPESVRITVDGSWPEGVTIKDFALRLIGDMGADGGLGMSIEFSGSAIDSLSIDSKMVLPNIMSEFGVKNAYIAPDEKTIDYLAERRVRRQRVLASDMAGIAYSSTSLLDIADKSQLSQAISQMKSQISQMAIFPDAGAEYVGSYRYEADQLEPYVARPHSPDNVVPISQVAGTPVQQAFLGTCTNGRLEDIAAAAEVLKGRRVSAKTRFLVIPASSEVLSNALRLGYIQTLVDAGATIGTPGCGPCMGNHMGVPAPKEVTISSGNRNFRGRMGTADSEVYISNPAVVAASAVMGYIADPRDI